MSQHSRVKRVVGATRRELRRWRWEIAVDFREHPLLPLVGIAPLLGPTALLAIVAGYAIEKLWDLGAWGWALAVLVALTIASIVMLAIAARMALEETLAFGRRAARSGARRWWFRASIIVVPGIVAYVLIKGFVDVRDAWSKSWAWLVVPIVMGVALVKASQRLGRLIDTYNRRVWIREQLVVAQPIFEAAHGATSEQPILDALVEIYGPYEAADHFDAFQRQKRELTELAAEYLRDPDNFPFSFQLTDEEIEYVDDAYRTYQWGRRRYL